VITQAVVPAGSKILSREQLLARRGEARVAGRRVVQCHGCFDIVHPGHLRHLRHAKAQGDVLLVSITGDSMIDKGTGRPLIPQELRAENLAALDCVDWVYVEARPTAVELLGELRPDVYVKGREYENNNDPRFKREQDWSSRWIRTTRVCGRSWIGRSLGARSCRG
jgi:rfaE bifunctional protein nucleotidyltransferase chain/domain